jgi:cobalamin biosynthesis protein CobD/CbiB
VAKIRDTVGLVKDSIADTRNLFDLQLQLLRAEVRELADFSKQIALLGAVALAALVPAVLFLGLALSGALSAYFTLPTWVGHTIVFVLFAAASVLPAIKAVRLIQARQSETP